MRHLDSEAKASVHLQLPAEQVKVLQAQVASQREDVA